MRPYLVGVDDSSEECFAGVAAHAAVVEVRHSDVSAHGAVDHGLARRQLWDRRGGGARVVVGLLVVGRGLLVVVGIVLGVTLVSNLGAGAGKNWSKFWN